MKNQTLIGYGLLIVLLQAGCQPAQPATATAATNSAVPAATQAAPAVSSPEATQEPAAVAASTLSPTKTKKPAATRTNFTPTPDTRLTPDQWQEWPYVPTISARAIEIYEQGLANGNDPHSFSVVGDCQSIPGVFLGMYDNPYGYKLDSAYNYLRDTVDYFKGSFGREGVAARGGFTAATILSPLQADPEVCKPGETPLTCEFRLHNPSILIISLEVGNPSIAQRYELYLRQIIDKSIERGVLPVLATKADVAELGNGQHVINPIIAKLAYEYDLPLWNFWRSAQPLFNHGIDPARDGFHLTPDGWNLKSFVALQTLDAIRRAVAGLPSVSPNQETASATQTPQTQTVLPAPPSQCATATDCVVFGLVESQDGDLQYKGVYWVNLASGKMAQAAPAGYNLQSVSPDGKFLLLNQGSTLLITPRNGGSPVKISDAFFDFSKQSAAWMPDGQGVAWISLEQAKTTLQLYDVAGASSKILSAPDDRPIALFPSFDPQGIYWQKGVCTGRDLCTPEGVWYSGLDGKPALELANVITPVFSPDGLSFAYMDPLNDRAGQYNDKLVLENIQTRLASRRLIVYPAAEGYEVRNRLVNYSWSPDSTKSLAIIADHSNYFEKALVLHTYITDLNNGMLTQYLKDKRLAGMLPQSVWSPDGMRVLLTLADSVKNPNFNYRVNLQVLDLATGQAQAFDQVPELISSNYIYITNIGWPK